MERKLVKETGCSWMLAHEALEEAKKSGIDSADEEKLLAQAKKIVLPKLGEDKARRSSRAVSAKPAGSEGKARDPVPSDSSPKNLDKKPSLKNMFGSSFKKRSPKNNEDNQTPKLNEWEDPLSVTPKINPGGVSDDEIDDVYLTEEEEKKRSPVPPPQDQKVKRPPPKKDIASDNESQASRSSLSRSSSRRASVSKRSLERSLVQQTGSSWRLAHEAVEQAKDSDIDVTDDEAVLAEASKIINPKLKEDRPIANRRPSSRSSKNLGVAAAAAGAGAAGAGAAAIALSTKDSEEPSSVPATRYYEEPSFSGSESSDSQESQEIIMRRSSSKSSRIMEKAAAKAAAAGAGKAAGKAAIASNAGSSSAAPVVVVPATRSAPRRGSESSQLSRSSSRRASASKRSLERELVQQTGSSWSLAHEAVEQAKESDIDITDDEAVLSEAKGIMSPKLEDDKEIAARRPSSKSKRNLGAAAAAVGAGAAVGVGAAAIASNTGSSAAKAPVVVASSVDSSPKPAAPVVASSVDSSPKPAAPVVAPVTRSVPRRGSEGSQLSRSSSRRGSTSKRSLERELVQQTGSSWMLAHEAVEQAKESDIDVTDDEAVLSEARGIMSPKLEDDKEIAGRRPSSKSKRNLGPAAAAGAAAGAGAAAIALNTSSDPPSVPVTRAVPRRGSESSQLSRSSSSRRGSKKNLERALVQETGSSWMLAHEAVEQAKESDIDITDDEAVLSEAKNIMAPKLNDDREVAARHPSSKSNKNLGAVAAGVGAGAAAGVGAAALASNVGSSAQNANTRNNNVPVPMVTQTLDSSDEEEKTEIAPGPPAHRRGKRAKPDVETTTFEIPSGVSTWLEENFSNDDIAVVVLAAASGKKLSRYARSQKKSSRHRRTNRSEYEEAELTLLRSELHEMRNEMQQVLKHSEGSNDES